MSPGVHERKDPWRWSEGPALPCCDPRQTLPGSRVQATERVHAGRCLAGSPHEQCRFVQGPRVWTV
eukprot:1747952-Lingulodinium_polyedra.AAC.1